MENEQTTNIENRLRKKLKIELFNDSFQNFKRYQIPKAQLVIADIPYNIGTDFYGSNPVWYKGGDNKNGESEKAKKAGFYSDFNFNIAEYFHFCNRLLKKDNDNEKVPRGRSSNNPCMIVFCSFEQQEIRVCELHPDKLYQELQPASFKSEYACSWCNRIRLNSVQI